MSGNRQSPPAVVWLPVRGTSHKGGRPPLACLTINDIVALIKRLVAVYENWSREGDISAHRPCPAEGCDCQFRHRHGWQSRFVVCGGRGEQIRVLRLFCPKCGKTETLSPEWLRRYSPYPWPWQEAAALYYVGGPGGYRPVASLFGVDYTVLWGWVDARRLFFPSLLTLTDLS